MTTGIRNRMRLASHRYRSTPYSLPSRRRDILKKEMHQKEINQRKKSRIALEKKDWEDATCSVCMEYPHNAVLLLCSSHEKGCRPYMCGTSYRYSNCLDQFKKAYTKVTSPPHEHSWHEFANNSGVGLASTVLSEKCEVMELACPLCRGQVKGMTVVEPAREYLNAKKRSCTQDNCSFTGTYKELRKHVKEEHPFARPREVDPTHEQKWRSLEREREHDDVLSTIRATMPGATVMGDYVIEGGRHGFNIENGGGEADEDYGGIDESSVFDFFFMYHSFRQAGSASFQNRLRRSSGFSFIPDENDDGVDFLEGANANEATLAAAFERGGENVSASDRRGRVLGRERSERRRRRRSQRRTVIDET